ANNEELFEKEFPIFVESWRKHWKKNFPIYQVQLSSINRPSWPYFRDVQRKLSEEIPFLYMAVSSDLGNEHDVHPIKKKEIGIRLANLALHYSYGKRNTIVEGPLPLKLEKKGNQFEITFKNGNHLKTNDGKPLRGFTIKNARGQIITP